MSKEIEATRKLYIRLRNMNGVSSSVSVYEWDNYLADNPRGIIVLSDLIDTTIRRIRPLIEARTRKKLLQQTIEYVDGLH